MERPATPGSHGKDPPASLGRTCQGQGQTEELLLGAVQVCMTADLHTICPWLKNRFLLVWWREGCPGGSGCSGRSGHREVRPGLIPAPPQVAMSPASTSSPAKGTAPSPLGTAAGTKKTDTEASNQHPPLPPQEESDTWEEPLFFLHLDVV